MAKQKALAGAAPAAAPRQTVATAAEAGLPLVKPVDLEAEVKALCKRNCLKCAWKDTNGNYHFDAAYVATLSPNSLTEILVD